MNDDVHPALAGVLNNFSAIARQARAANDSACNATGRAVACQVKVSSADVHETRPVPQPRPRAGRRNAARR